MRYTTKGTDSQHTDVLLLVALLVHKLFPLLAHVLLRTCLKPRPDLRCPIGDSPSLDGPPRVNWLYLLVGRATPPPRVPPWSTHGRQRSAEGPPGALLATRWTSPPLLFDDSTLSLDTSRGLQDRGVIVSRVHVVWVVVAYICTKPVSTCRTHKGQWLAANTQEEERERAASTPHLSIMPFPFPPSIAQHNHRSPSPSPAPPPPPPPTPWSSSLTACRRWCTETPTRSSPTDRSRTTCPTPRYSDDDCTACGPFSPTHPTPSFPIHPSPHPSLHACMQARGHPRHACLPPHPRAPAPPSTSLYPARTAPHPFPQPINLLPPPPPPQNSSSSTTPRSPRSTPSSKRTSMPTGL